MDSTSITVLYLETVGPLGLSQTTFTWRRPFLGLEYSEKRSRAVAVECESSALQSASK